MGQYTENNYFYKPAYGTSGHPEKDKFDAALETADTQIEDNKDNIESNTEKINSGEVPEKTIAQMEAITDSKIRLVVITDRFVGQYILEVWIGASYYKKL